MDTLTSIVQTAKKLVVNGYEYLQDRISGLRKMPSLASLIRQRSRPPPTFPLAHHPPSSLLPTSHCSPVWRVASISQDTHATSFSRAFRVRECGTARAAVE